MSLKIDAWTTLFGFWESNPGHMGGRRAFFPLHQPCSPITLRKYALLRGHEFFLYNSVNRKTSHTAKEMAMYAFAFLCVILWIIIRHNVLNYIACFSAQYINKSLTHNHSMKTIEQLPLVVITLSEELKMFYVFRIWKLSQIFFLRKINKDFLLLTEQEGIIVSARHTRC